MFTPIFLGACNWSSWTECSKTCDIGPQERIRAENCNGDSKETKSCGKPDWCLLETLKKIFWWRNGLEFNQNYGNATLMTYA